MKRRTVIVVGGWAHAADALAPLASALARGYDVRTASPTVLYASAAAAGFASRSHDAGVSAYARALRSLVSDLEVPPCLVGWSMGALIVLEALGRLSLAAEKIVLLGGTPRFCAGEGYATGVPPQNLRALNAGLRRDPANALGGFYREAAFPRAVSAGVTEARTAEAMTSGLDVLSDGLVYLRETDVRDVLDGIACPALVLHGRQDRIVPWEAGELLGRRLPKGRFVLYKDAGHDLIAAMPECVSLRIGEFLEASPCP